MSVGTRDACAERREEWRVQTEWAMTLPEDDPRRIENLAITANAKRMHPECVE